MGERENLSLVSLNLWWLCRQLLEQAVRQQVLLFLTMSRFRQRQVLLTELSDLFWELSIPSIHFTCRKGWLPSPALMSCVMHWNLTPLSTTPSECQDQPPLYSDLLIKEATLFLTTQSFLMDSALSSRLQPSLTSQ